MKLFIKFYLLIFCFLNAQNHWETAIYANDDWNYLVPISEPSTDWNTLDFSDTSWFSGPGGFGYGDGDDGTVIDQTLSVYFRTDFSVPDISKFYMAVLHADYDDGFVAYINGVEICRSANLGQPGTFVPFDETTSTDHEAQLYNGGIPEAYTLDSLELSQLLIMGDNVLAIQVHNVGESSSDMSSNIFLSFGIIDTSNFYGPTPDWFQLPIVFNESHLPIIVIDTFGEEIPDDPRIPAQMGIINNWPDINHIGDSYNDYDGMITIELRGNSSQSQPKKPYRLETVNDNGENNNVSLLGMPEENDWVLYAPWSDKTFIRNVLTYQLSNEMGRYASRTRYCELYINEDYKGIYVLMEKIKRDQNRVDISKLTPDETTGDDVTGGYILKFDWFWTGDNLGGFESSHGSLYNYHYPQPDDIAPEQEAYIQQYIENFEDMMLGQGYNDPNIGYPAHMDVGSFIDLIMLHELSKNVDAYRLSTYIYKDKESIDDRLIAGPIWDINHGYGNCDYGNTWETTDWLLDYDPTGDPIAFWWETLWDDENFKTEFSYRYTELRSTILSEENIASIIDSITTYLGPAISRNFARWPILGSYVWPNYYVFDTYSEEIEYLKNWTNMRLEWMDQEMLILSPEIYTEIDTICAGGQNSGWMDLGAVEIGDSSQCKLFVENPGEGDLILTNIQTLEPENSVTNYHYRVNVDSLIIGPQDSDSIIVTFAPDTAGFHSGWLYFETNVSSHPTHYEAIHAAGLSSVGAIHIDTDFESDTMYFYDATLGDPTYYEYLYICNLGNTELEIDSIVATEPFYVNINDASLGTLEWLDVEVQFFPEYAGEYFGTVTVYNNDIDEGEIMIHLYGNTEFLTVDGMILPDKFAVHQNYPNPFNPVTTLRYHLPEDALVNIIIYDVMGRQVRTLVSNQQSAGYKSVQWNATNDTGEPISAGLYLYRIEAGEFRQTKKMVLLK